MCAVGLACLCNTNPKPTKFFILESPDWPMILDPRGLPPGKRQASAAEKDEPDRGSDNCACREGHDPSRLDLGGHLGHVLADAHQCHVGLYRLFCRCLRSRPARVRRPGGGGARRPGVVFHGADGDRDCHRRQRHCEPALGRARLRDGHRGLPAVHSLGVGLRCDIDCRGRGHLPARPAHAGRLAAGCPPGLELSKVQLPGHLPADSAVGLPFHFSGEGKRENADAPHGRAYVPGGASRCRVVPLPAAPRHKRHRRRLDDRRIRLLRALVVSKEYPLRFSWSWAWRVLKIGIPSGLQDVAWVAGNFVLFAIFAMTPDPTSCQAAWAIGLRVEDAAASMPMFALSLGLATIVGQNLGAGQPARAEKTAWQAAGIVAIYMGLVAVAMVFGAYPIAHLLSGSEPVARCAAQYLQIVGISEPFQGVWLVLFGAMEGAGYTRWPTLIAGVCLLGVRLPLAWFLTVPMHMGPAGTWISIAVSYAITFSLTVACFKMGRWKTQQV